MRRFLILWLFLSGAASAFSQVCGLEDTLFINRSITTSHDFIVNGIINNELSDPGQGVCAVELDFVHTYVDRLEISLTSPGGQTLQLVGPITNQQNEPTNFARWKVTFVPCSETAVPDPGSLQAWDNVQMDNFVIGGRYDGSYYPSGGCLENFTTGPVNGAWQINIVDAFGNSLNTLTGAILGFRIRFCDELGLDCCFADAGSLAAYPDVLACEGNDSLAFEVSPDYSGNPPDTSEYGYTYAISSDSILLEYDSLPDFSSFPPGVYQLCGLSYKKTERDSFPAPDGLLSIDSLRRNLDGLTPIFCGDITEDCIRIEIGPPPATTFISNTICEGDTVMVGDSALVSTGIYDITLLSYAGCDSLVNYDLTAIPTERTSLVETICEGDSVVVGSSVYLTSGLYADTLQSAALCDSIVNLDLTVLPPIITNTSAVICLGDTVMVGDSLLTQTGDYEIVLPSAQQCDSIVRISLRTLDVQASIAAPDTLSCRDPVITLDGSASSPLDSLAFSWAGPGGPIAGNIPIIDVSQPGLYTLEVVQTSGTLQCFSQASVEVPADTIAPTADAGLADTLSCAVQQITLGGPNTTTGPEFSYSWTTTDGNFSSPANTATTTVDAPGSYQLLVENTRNGCRDNAFVTISENIQLPQVAVSPDTTLNCVRSSLQLSGVGSSTGPAFSYSWQSDDGTIPENPNTLTPTVTQDGRYRLLVRNTETGCVDSAFVQVAYDTIAPQVAIAGPAVINCAQPTVTLDAAITNGEPGLDFFWNLSNGANIIAGANTLLPEVDAAGTYELLAVNPVNGCRDSASVIVVENINTIIADPAPGGLLTCANDTLQLDALNSTTAPDIIYSWSSPNGHFAADSTGITVEVDAPGTYQLIVQDTLTFCADTALVTVTQDTIHPIADAGPDRLITCDSSTVTLDGSASSTMGSYDYDWVAVLGVDLIGTNTLHPVAIEPGLYLLVVTDINNGCLDTSLVEVAIDTLPPQASIAEPGMLNCAQPELTLDATASDSGLSYALEWTAMEGGQIVAGAGSLTPTVNAAGRYELEITNELTGCTNSAAAVVRDSTLAVLANIEGANLLSCDSTTLILSAAGSTTGPDIVYSWATVDGNILGDTLGSSIQLDLPGTYRLFVRDTITFCADTAELVVSRDANLPLADAGAGFEINCTLTEGVLDGSASDSGPNFTYRWEGPCIINGQDSLRATVNCSGTYAFTVENTLTGCRSTDVVEITQDGEIPIAQVDGNYTLTCDTLARTLDARNSSQGINFVYSWEGPGIVSGANSLQPTVNLPGQYILTVEDTVNTCLANTTITVAQDTLSPVADAGPDGVISCDVTTLELGGVGTSAGPEFSYSWTTADGNINGPTDQAMVSIDRPGEYQILVTNNRNGCRDFSLATVSDATAPPRVEAGPDREIDCGNPEVLLDGSASDGGPEFEYLWSGPCLISAADSSRVLADCPGLYVLEVANTGTGCSATDSVQVTRDALIPRAVLPDSLSLSCESGTLLIDGTASEGVIFDWYREGQAMAEDGLTLLVDEPGTFQLVANTLARDCADTAAVEVIIDCVPLAAIATPDTLTCAITTVTLDGSASTAGSNISYQWTEPGPSCIMDGQGANTAGVRCDGEYALIVTNTLFGLSDTATVVVVSNTTAPIADAGTSDTLTCDQPTAILSAGGSSQGQGIGYFWSNLEETFNGEGLMVEISDDGTYFLTVIDSLTGCTDEDIVVVERSADLPDVAFGARVFPCLQDSFWLQAFVEPAGEPYNFLWQGDNILGFADSSAVLLDTTGQLMLTVVNANTGCTVSREVEVTEQDCIPCIEIEAADSLTCLVDEVLFSAAFCEPCEGCTLEWSTAEGQIIGDNSGLEVRVNAPGTYTLTATDTLGFSEVVEVMVIENTEAPAVDAGPDQTLDCERTQVQLGVPGSSLPRLAYAWLDENGTRIDSLATTIVNAPGAYTLRATDRITGCEATDEVLVIAEVLPPLAEAGPDQLLTCTQPSVILDGSGSDFGPRITYFWTGPPAANIGGANSFNPTVNTTGIYYLLVRDTLTGCSALDSVAVTQDASLPPVPELSDTSLTCAAPDIVLMGERPAQPGFSVRWCRLGPNGQPQGACANEEFVGVSQPGIYRFEVTNDSTGCSNFVDIEVVNNFEPPIVDAGPDGTLLCSVDSLQLSASASPANVGFSYDWSSLGGSSIGNADGPTPFIYQADTFLLEATRLDNGCTATDTVVIGLDDNAPQLTVGPDTSLNCRQLNLRLQASVSTLSGEVELAWRTMDGNIVLGGDGLNPLIDAPGTYVLEATDPANGCSSAASVTVSADREPPVAAIDSLPMELNCRREMLTLSAGPSFATDSSALRYEWRQLPQGTIGNDSTLSLSLAGNYLLIVESERTGCRDTLPFSVSSNFRQPEVQLAPPPSLTCRRTEVTIDGSGSVSGENIRYQWIGPAGDTLSETSAQLSVQQPGIYQLLATDEENGCQAGESVQVRADTLPPTADIRETEALDCIVRTVELDGSLSSLGSEFSYLWSTTEGQLLAGEASLMAEAGASGTYFLLVTNENNGCTARDSVEVIESVTPIEVLLAQGLPPSCPGREDGRVVLDTVIGGMGPYLFALDGGTFSSREQFDLLPPGEYLLKVQDVNGCEDSSRVVVPEAENLIVDLGPDIIVQLGQTDTLFAKITPAAYDTIWWWPTDSLASPSREALVISPSISNVYTVWVSNGEGCTASDQIVVSVVARRPVYAPTAFSPNGDGNNDRFTLYGAEGVINIRTFQIFDRWGNMVYEDANFLPNDPTLGWDGSLNGMPMDPAVFVFYAEVELANGEVEVVKGDVVLMR